MSEIDYRNCIRGIKNDLKIAIDDALCVLENIADDVELLKVKTSRPDKHAAALLLDYLGWEEIAEYMKWLDYYCKKEGTTREQALKAVIDGKV